MLGRKSKEGGYNQPTVNRATVASNSCGSWYHGGDYRPRVKRLSTKRVREGKRRLKWVS